MNDTNVKFYLESPDWCSCCLASPVYYQSLASLVQTWTVHQNQSPSWKRKCNRLYPAAILEWKEMKSALQNTVPKYNSYTDRFNYLCLTQTGHCLAVNYKFTTCGALRWNTNSEPFRLIAGILCYYLLWVGEKELQASSTMTVKKIYFTNSMWLFSLYCTLLDLIKVGSPLQWQIGWLLCIPPCPQGDLETLL